MKVKMKDSGIEWIGEIPEDWKVIKIGSIFACRNEKVSDSDFTPLSVSKDGVVYQMKNVAKSDAGDNRKLVLKNDFVINSRSDRKQSCGVSTLDGSVSLINIVLYEVTNGVIYSGYTKFVMKNYGFAEEFYRWGHGIVADLWTTGWQEMKNIGLPIPSFSEQQQIAAYLDKKCALVERLIENQRRQIEKLKEYKQSVITETVTKGLDHSVPMKDSGIEWIGEIPEDWKVVKIKFVAPLRVQKRVDENYRYIGLENVESNTCKYISSKSEYDLSLSNIAYEGDVIFGKLRPYLSKVYLIESTSCVSSEFCVFTPQKIDKGFFKYSILSSHFINIVNSSTFGTKMPRANAEYIKNLTVAFPNMKTQQQIAAYLDKKCAEIDALIAIKQQKIDKLQEYKKSLIYEYVTGKKQVV